MRTLYIIYCLLFLIACDNSKNKDYKTTENQVFIEKSGKKVPVYFEEGSTSEEGFLIEKSIGSYLLSIQMKSEYLEVGNTNQIKVNIKGVSAEKITVATIAREASIKNGKAVGYFDIDVTEETEKVTLVVSLADTLNHERVFLDELDLKTNYNK